MTAMTRRKAPFVTNEWYHCFNRSIDGRSAFNDDLDYQRFIQLLYLANDVFPLRYSDLGRRDTEQMLKVSRGKRLVSIGAFCLMQNHFHLALREDAPGGISTFMRKVGTAYTMYFNMRNGRRGNLFLKPFQSLPAPTTRDLQRLVSFVHSRPAVLYEGEWEAGTVVDPQFLEEHLVSYRYSSLASHMGIVKPATAILNGEIFSLIRAPSVQKMLQEARQYPAHPSLP